MGDQKTTAVFGDLTALYATRSHYQKTINYRRLDEVLRQEMDVDKWDVNAWYTLFSESNDGQVNFVDGLKDFGWEVHTANIRNVRRINRDDRPTDYRFDARISYELGACAETVDRVLVVSDSYDLLPSLMQLHEDDANVEITLAFFSDALDGRWWKVLNAPNCPIKFLDLEEKLFG